MIHCSMRIGVATALVWVEPPLVVQKIDNGEVSSSFAFR